jgi:hypothetical protein
VNLGNRYRPVQRPSWPRREGLLALMLLIESRRATRATPNGDLVLVSDQDRGRWDRSLINEGPRSFATACGVASPACTRSSLRSSSRLGVAQDIRGGRSRASSVGREDDPCPPETQVFREQTRNYQGRLCTQFS